MSEHDFTDDNEKEAFTKQIHEHNSKLKKMLKNNQIINGCTIDSDSCFGINDYTINGQLTIVGDGKIVFSSSNAIVIKDVNTKQFTFVQKENRFKNVTAIYACQKKKKNNGGKEIIIAAGESSKNDDRNAMIVVANADKKKYWILNQRFKGTVKQIGLNVEKKYCLGLVQPEGSQNTPSLNLWNYKKERFIAEMKVKANNCKFSFHPTKPTLILMSGFSYLRMLEVKYQEKVIKESATSLVPLKFEKDNKFLDHVWVTHQGQSTLVVLTTGNRVFLLQNDQFKRSMYIDLTNLNITPALVREVNMEDSDEEDTPRGVHHVLEEIVSEEKEKDNYGDFISRNPQKYNYGSQIPEFVCLAATKQGFILAGHHGNIVLYNIEKTYNNINLVNTMSFRMIVENQNSTIYNMSSSGNDSLITIASYGSMGQNAYHLLNTYQLDSDISPIQPFFTAGFHSKKINSISTCITKKIFATCSEDNTVKIWNYFESENIEKRGILSQQFKEEPVSLSLHPTGMFLAVGFQNRFKIFSILLNKLYLIKEVPLTQCTIVKYAHGGQFLLTNSKDKLLIFNTTYYEYELGLEGHMTLINKVSISEDDQFIVSTCMKGFVFFWDLFMIQELKKHSHDRSFLKKQFDHEEVTEYNCILIDTKSLREKKDLKANKEDQEKEKKKVEEKPMMNLIVAATQDKYLQFFEKSQITDKRLIAEFPVLNDVFITCMQISHKLGVIFMGTNKGKIRISMWPIKEDTMEFEQINPNSNKIVFKYPEFWEFQAHSNYITTLELNHDHQYIFTGDVDGIVIMLKVKDIFKDGQLVSETKNQREMQMRAKKDEQKIIENTQNDLYLNKLKYLNDQNNRKKQSEQEVLKLENTKKIETFKLESDYDNKVRDITREHEQIMNGIMNMQNSFETQHNETYTQLQKELGQKTDDYNKEIDRMRSQQDEKLNYEKQRNDDIISNIEQMKQQQQADLKKLIIDHKERIKSLESNFITYRTNITDKYKEVVDNARNFGNAFMERLYKQDQEHEKDNDENVCTLKDKIEKVRQTNDVLFEQNNLQQLTYNALKIEDEKKQKEFEDLFRENNRISYIKLTNLDDWQKKKSQAVEREQVIASKEESCKHNKDAQISLENFRYMLDQKIKRLQTDKAMILEKIAQKEDNLKKMFNELIKEAQKNDKNLQELHNLKQKVKIINNQTKKTEIEMFFNSNKLTQLQNQLASIMKSQEPMWVIGKLLYEMLETIKEDKQMRTFLDKKEITNDDIKEIIKLKQEKPNEVNEGLIRSGRWFNKKILLEELQNKKLKDIREDNIDTYLKQNTKLIEECNLLREENEQYRKKTKNVEQQLAESINKRQELRHQQQQKSLYPQKQFLQAMQKIDENKKALEQQKEKIQMMQDWNEELAGNKSNNDSVLPPINKSKQNPNMSTANNSQTLSTDVSQSKIGIAPQKGAGKTLYNEIVQEVPQEMERCTTSEMRKKRYVFKDKVDKV